MSRRWLAVAAILAAAVAAAAVLAARGESRPSTFDRLTNQGRPVSLAGLLPMDRAELESASVVELRLLADRGGLRFYRAITRNGRNCVALAREVDGQERFGSFGCPTSFPSDDVPVADLTQYTQGLDDVYPAAAEIAGFAADGIDAVGVRAPDGKVRWVPVAGNVYFERPEGVQAAGLLFRDQHGRVVVTLPVGGRTPREEYGVTG